MVPFDMHPSWNTEKTTADPLRTIIAILIVPWSLFALRLPIAEATSDIISFATPSEKTNQTSQIDLWWQVMGWGVVLILVLIVSAMAIIIFSRRIREFLIRGKQQPTQAEDVWTMHTLPDDLDLGKQSPPSSSDDDEP